MGHQAIDGGIKIGPSSITRKLGDEIKELDLDTHANTYTRAVTIHNFLLGLRQEIDVDADTIQSWKERYGEGGIEALKEIEIEPIVLGEDTIDDTQPQQSAGEEQSARYSDNSDLIEKLEGTSPNEEEMVAETENDRLSIDNSSLHTQPPEDFYYLSGSHMEYGADSNEDCADGQSVVKPFEEIHTLEALPFDEREQGHHMVEGGLILESGPKEGSEVDEGSTDSSVEEAQQSASVEQSARYSDNSDLIEKLEGEIKELIRDGVFPNTVIRARAVLMGLCTNTLEEARDELNKSENMIFDTVDIEHWSDLYFCSESGEGGDIKFLKDLENDSIQFWWAAADERPIPESIGEEQNVTYSISDIEEHYPFETDEELYSPQTFEDQGYEKRYRESDKEEQYSIDGRSEDEESYNPLDEEVIAESNLNKGSRIDQNVKDLNNRRTKWSNEKRTVNQERNITNDSSAKTTVNKYDVNRRNDRNSSEAVTLRAALVSLDQNSNTAKRVSALLNLINGEKIGNVAKSAQVDRQSVRRWKKIWDNGGMVGLNKIEHIPLGGVKIETDKFPKWTQELELLKGKMDPEKTPNQFKIANALIQVLTGTGPRLAEVDNKLKNRALERYMRLLRRGGVQALGYLILLNLQIMKKELTFPKIALISLVLMTASWVNWINKFIKTHTSALRRSSLF